MPGILKWKRKIFLTLGSILIFVVLVILLISPIAKYAIEKYDTFYTGREIQIGRIYVNPFSGFLYFSNFRIHELKSDSIFFSSEGLSISVSLFSLLTKEVEIERIEFDRPSGIVLQSKNGSNFIDLIKLFSKGNPQDTTHPVIHLNVNNVIINNGSFYYRDLQIPVDYFIKDVNIVSTGKQWNSDSTHAKFSFIPGIGSGKIKGDLKINLKNMAYQFSVQIEKFDLNLIGQYLKDLTNNGVFSANLDANIKSSGSLLDQEDVSISGVMQINDFHFGKSKSNDFISFEKLQLGINELSPKNHKYLFDSVLLSHPYIKYEKYDSLDNIQNMIGKNGSMLTNASSSNAKFNLIIEIARYVKILARNFFESSYQIRQLAIDNGNIEFNDFSPGEVFSIGLYPLFIRADSIDKNHKNVNVDFRSGIIPYGKAEVKLNINPSDSATFNLEYEIKNLPAALFNPYTIAYTSFPLDRGAIELNGKWNVRNGNIESINHLVILDPRVTKRLARNDTKWKPLSWIMSLIRERTNVIDYEIPITGNLKNPNFHLNDIVFDIIGNIFIKPATTLYRIELKNIESEIEKSQIIKWDMNSSNLTETQDKYLKTLTGYLNDNPGASVVITPQIYRKKEEEYILLYNAKLKFLLDGQSVNSKNINERDSEMTERMSVKDPEFTKYLDNKVNDTMIFTTQEKCLRIIEPQKINSQMKLLSKERQNVFIRYFSANSTEQQVSFGTEENVIPYNGFSFYKIEFKGELPSSLKKAYKKLNEMDEQSPRDKFKEDRNNSKVSLIM